MSSAQSECSSALYSAGSESEMGSLMRYLMRYLIVFKNNEKSSLKYFCFDLNRLLFIYEPSSLANSYKVCGGGGFAAIRPCRVLV